MLVWQNIKDTKKDWELVALDFVNIKNIGVIMHPYYCKATRKVQLSSLFTSTSTCSPTTTVAYPIKYMHAWSNTQNNYWVLEKN